MALLYSKYPEKKPHKHAELIKAWADGEKIQYRKPNEQAWKDSDTPAWVEDYEYRVKPCLVEPVYPVTQMNMGNMCSAYFNGGNVITPADELLAFKRIANAALRHAIDAGQVVTREEFDKLAAINATLRKAIPINFD
jgi:hypothetical protein